MEWLWAYIVVAGICMLGDLIRLVFILAFKVPMKAIKVFIGPKLWQGSVGHTQVTLKLVPFTSVMELEESFKERSWLTRFMVKVVPQMVVVVLGTGAAISGLTKGITYGGVIIVIWVLVGFIASTILKSIVNR